MNRLGTILIPMLAGFLLTGVVVSWRSGWWARHELQSPAAAPLRVEARRPNLRIVPVHLTAAQTASVAASAAAPVPAASVPAPPPPGGGPEPASQPLAPPPVPRANVGNSPDLEAPVRKFARGSGADAE